MLDVVRGGPHIGAAPPTKLGFCSAMISLISVAEGEQSLGQLSGPEPSKSVELAWGEVSTGPSGEPGSPATAFTNIVGSAVGTDAD